MTPDDYDAFVEIVAGFAELKGRELSAAAIKLYWHAMQDWAIDEFRRAAEHLLRTSAWMPTPKEFEDLRKAQRPTAGEAWARVLEHIRGAYRERPALDTGPIDEAVKALGGYHYLAHYNVEFLGVLEKRFREHYETAQDVGAARAALPELAAPTSTTLRLRHDQWQS